MTEATLEHELERVFGEVFPAARVPPQALERESAPGWDSSGHLNLLLAIEEEFGVQLSDDEALGLHSFGEARRILARRLCR